MLIKHFNASFIRVMEPMNRLKRLGVLRDINKGVPPLPNMESSSPLPSEITQHLHCIHYLTAFNISRNNLLLVLGQRQQKLQTLHLTQMAGKAGGGRGEGGRAARGEGGARGGGRAGRGEGGRGEEGGRTGDEKEEEEQEEKELEVKEEE